MHATSNKYDDPQYTALNCSGTGTGVTNTAFYAFKTNTAGSLILSVSGYGTTPAAEASCTPTAGYTVAAGVEIAIYAVSSCPAGQSFPAPIACRTFNGNGVISSVSGLSGNTTYLLVADGIENTKASFNLMFGGSVLPVKFESFTGAAMPGFNQLKWIVEFSSIMKKIFLEKSDNGTNFTSIKEIDSFSISSTNQYNDNNPFTGNNYYRLVIENSDGSKEYSNIILLTREEKFFASIYPNPTTSVINVEINTAEMGKYSFDVYNTIGQLVLHQNQDIALKNQVITLPAQKLGKGNYFVRVLNDRNEVVKNLAVIINN